MLFIFGKRNSQNETKRNETANETDKNPESFDITSYVNNLKQSFDPSRARDRDYMAFQLSQIDEHLGGLVE